MLEWKVRERMELLNFPPVITYQCVIGNDDKGNTWLCQARMLLKDQYKGNGNKWMLKFDIDGETAFMRDEVLEAENYWEEAEKAYHIKCSDFDNIVSEISNFKAEHHIR